MNEVGEFTLPVIAFRLLAAGVIGALIGYERHLYYKAIGIASMVLITVGSASYMMLGIHLAATDNEAIGRALQGVLQGIGFLGAGVIFKGGTDVRGIKTAATIWATGAIGIAIGTSYWALGITAGLATAGILLLADFFPALGNHSDVQPNVSEKEKGKVSYEDE